MARSGFRRPPALAAVSTIGILGGIGLAAADRIVAGLALLATVVAVDVVMAGRLSRRAALAQQDRFDAWARTRGLEPEDLSPRLLERFALAGMYVDFERAATWEGGDARVTLFEVSQSQGGQDGRRTWSTGLLIRGPQTRTTLELRPASRIRFPALPGGSRRYETGIARFDGSAHIVVRRGDPQWLAHPEVAATVTGLLSMELRALQVDGDVMMATFPRLDADRWDELLDRGRELAAVVRQRCVPPPA